MQNFKIGLLVYMFLAQFNQYAQEQTNMLDDYLLRGEINLVAQHLAITPNDIDYKNASGETTLMLAIKSKSLLMFMEILTRTKKENLNIKVNNKTVFDYVTGRIEHPAIFIQMLISKGIKFEQSVLIWAIINADLDVLNILLKSYPDQIKNMKINGELVMHLAFKCKDKKNIKNVIKLLLVNGIDINSRDSEKLTVLNKAIDLCDIDLIRFLIANGANGNLLDKNSYNAISYAIKLRDLNFTDLQKYDSLFEIIRFLHSKGIDRQNSASNNLNIAATYADYEVVRFFILQGHNLNDTNQDKVVQGYYNQEREVNKKERYRKIYELLKLPIKDVVENDKLLQRVALLEAVRRMNRLKGESRIIEHVTDIIESFCDKPIKKKDIIKNNKLIAFNKVIELIEFNKTEELGEFLNQKPQVLFLKNVVSIEDDKNIITTPFLYAIKIQNMYVISVILQIFNKLIYQKSQQLNESKTKRQKIDNDEAASSSSSTDQHLEELEEEFKHVKHNIESQLQQAYDIIKASDNEKLKKLLEYYKNSVFDNLFSN